jgi:hypothetical protein
MMIQLAGIHNGFHNKNYLDNIDIVGIDIVDIGNIEHMKVAGEHMKAVGEHMKAVGEYTEVVGEYTEVVEEYTEVVGEHMKAVGEHTEYTEVVGNREIAEVQQHW